MISLLSQTYNSSFGLMGSEINVEQWGRKSQKYLCILTMVFRLPTADILCYKVPKTTTCPRNIFACTRCNALYGWLLASIPACIEHTHHQILYPLQGDQNVHRWMHRLPKTQGFCCKILQLLYFFQLFLQDWLIAFIMVACIEKAGHIFCFSTHEHTCFTFCN